LHPLSRLLAQATLALSLAAPTIAPADELPRTITVTGSGSVDAGPDLARLGFAVERRNAAMRVARDGVVRVSQDFLALCKRLGIPENKVRTAGLSIQPEYRYENDGSPPVLVGYIVQRQLDVELTNLDKLGELIEGAIDAGITQTSPPQLDSSRRADRHRDALAAAATDARRNAERIATTLGAKLGPVRQVSIGEAVASPVPMPMAKLAMSAESADAAGSYTPGEVSFEARVTVVFDLLAP
jgi:uncharacterized protein YggE